MLVAPRIPPVEVAVGVRPAAIEEVPEHALAVDVEGGAVVVALLEDAGGFSVSAALVGGESARALFQGAEDVLGFLGIGEDGGGFGSC